MEEEEVGSMMEGNMEEEEVGSMMEGHMEEKVGSMMEGHMVVGNMVVKGSPSNHIRRHIPILLR
jgi:hypothetical protein